MRVGQGDRPVLKIIRQHPEVNELELSTGHLSSELLSRLFGKRADAVRKLMAKKDCCRVDGDGTCSLTWKFRNLSIDDFNLGMSSKLNGDIFRSLQAELWSPCPEGEGVDRFIRILHGEEDADGPACRISETEYWYRQGNVVTAFQFSSEPSSELLQLIEMKLEMIQQEKMQNYFHIISSFNSDVAMWMNVPNRNRHFFDIIEQMLSYTWRPFDMASFEVSIDAAGDEGLIASGSLKVEYSEDGFSTSCFDSLEKQFPAARPGGREFVVNDVILRAAGQTDQSSLLSLRMNSRTTGNVDPRRNMLTHRFLKLFMESVGKLLDVVMPVIRREEALRNLKWSSFLDTLRLKLLTYGEDLHYILTESLKLLRRFYGISEVLLFSEDREIAHMLDLFARKDIGEKAYLVLDNPLSPADILRRQLVVFPIREIQGERILLYYEIPRTGPRPLNPDIPDRYLMGTDLWLGVSEEAAILGLQDLKDFIFFMVTECLTPNPKGVIENLIRRLPVRGGHYDQEAMIRLSRQILKRYGRVFDTFNVLSGSLESGIAYMRGRRDNLTGLYNRQHFTATLNDFFLRPNYSFGLMFIDMDNFKIFNDAVSHDFGDKLLTSLANRMIECADSIEEAVPGRFGGDEFCFSVGNINKENFEEASIKVFKGITARPLVVSFYLEDRVEGPGMEINLIAFLFRLMRPDVGSRQASRIEYVEKAHTSPKNRVLDIWKHYIRQKGEEIGSRSVKSSRIVDDIASEIEDKIIYNKLFPKIDQQLHKVICDFVLLQLRDYTTSRIRDYLISSNRAFSIERKITLKVSAGLAHSSEDRLRSMESLFKAADGRAYLAKHNGRNCLFGVDGQRLA